jgi:hypothetical protein
MADSAAEDGSESFDVALIQGKTGDGGGAKVLRIRPGRIDSGEMRPLQDGRPLGSGDIVRLERRADVPALFDVHVVHTIEEPVHGSSKPAQVATSAYRESWDRTFGPRRTDAPN